MNIELSKADAQFLVDCIDSVVKSTGLVNAAVGVDLAQRIVKQVNEQSETETDD